MDMERNGMEATRKYSQKFNVILRANKTNTPGLRQMSRS